MAKIVFTSKIPDPYLAVEVFLRTQTSGVRYAFEETRLHISKIGNVVTAKTFDHKDDIKGQ